MLKSFSEFVSLPATELIQIFQNGPLLVTLEDEPQFVAQSLDDYESMVRKLRELEAVTRRDRIRRARVVPIRP